MSIESVILANHLILCHPLVLLPSVFPIIRVFSNELTLSIKWPKYRNFSFGISPSNEYSGLIWSLVLISCSLRDSQESSPAPQFESIKFLALSLLYGPTFEGRRDKWFLLSVEFEVVWRWGWVRNGGRKTYRASIEVGEGRNCPLWLWLKSTSEQENVAGQLMSKKIHLTLLWYSIYWMGIQQWDTHWVGLIFWRIFEIP